ncbi:hypothetical protein [Arthrobacter sp. PAMC 25486]|uniref:hypothetical protein n=1 Tax=Arthrobacter sp. PAMC 25486 TaxID=1494608 RepID=UPI00138E47AA|nr:hypothetical protein [Arthrobacter sp. PAMC 25486]
MLPDDSAATAAVARLRSLVDKELERLVTEEVSSDLRLLWMDTMLAMLNSDDASRYEENAAAFYAYGSRVQSEGRKHGLITIERP